ncbi:MAG: YDG domain-containing protein, partial [Bacteroidota bacterium]|nr:YDG domain-containing protein [Bacteroidota bacterium]
MSASGLTATNYAITYAAGSLVTSKKAVTLTGLAASKTYDGLTSYTNTADDLTALSGQLGVSGDTITAATQAYADKNASTGKTVTLSGATVSDGNSGNNYTITYATNNSGEISKKALTVSGITAANKEYDGTTAATLSVGSAVFGGKVTGDDLSIDTGVLSGSFADANASTNKAVNLTGATLSGTDAGNYTLSGVGGVTADITQKALTVTATDAARTYDGTNWTGGNGVSYNGFITGEDATALGGTLAYVGTAQNSRNAGTYTLSASGLTATNYAITYAAGSLVTSKKAVTLTGLATSKVYDGGLTYTTSASDLTSLGSQLGVSGDTVTAATQAYTDRNVGTGKTVTVSGASISDGNSGNNYTVTYANGSSGAITKLDVTVADITAANKTYSGTTAATLSAASASITGKVSGDALNVDAAGLSGSFDTKNVGTGKTVNYTGIALSGADAGNYNLSSSTGTTTADISKLDVTVADITALNKTYDRTTGATMSTSSASITGKVAGDALNVDATGLSGTFDTWNAGNGKTVSYTGVALSGADAGNYNLTSSTGTATANITPRSLTVSGITAANKDYDGTTSVALSVGAAAFSGVLGADVVTITPNVIGGSFADKNAGTSKAINLTGVALSGTEAGNYTLDSVVGVTADIAPVALQIAANDMTYAYNGTNFSQGNGVTYTGFVNGETSGVLDGTLAYGGTSQGAKNAGSYTLVASGLTTSNYTIEYVDGALIITPKALTMTGVTATDKIYDGNTSATVSGGTLNGLVGTETLNVTKTGMFDTPDAGTGKTVRVMVAMADGINGGLASNYTLDDTTTTA